MKQVKTWTHPGSLRYLNVSGSNLARMLPQQNRYGAIVGINTADKVRGCGHCACRACYNHQRLTTPFRHDSYCTSIHPYGSDVTRGEGAKKQSKSLVSLTANCRAVDGS